MTEMLKVLDDFENAMKSTDGETLRPFMNSLSAVLKANGLEKLDVIGKDYSPDIAEVVSTEKIEGKQGKIVEEIQSGYALNGKVIRYPKVKISL